jgi:hypothetical protein
MKLIIFSTVAAAMMTLSAQAGDLSIYPNQLSCVDGKTPNSATLYLFDEHGQYQNQSWVKAEVGKKDEQYGCGWFRGQLATLASFNGNGKIVIPETSLTEKYLFDLAVTTRYAALTKRADQLGGALNIWPPYSEDQSNYVEYADFLRDISGDSPYAWNLRTYMKTFEDHMQSNLENAKEVVKYTPAGNAQ